MRLLHVISGLRTGGAETMLYKLLAGAKTSRDAIVVSLGEDGPMGAAIAALGVPVVPLGATPGRVPTPAALLRLVRLVRAFAPDVVQGWMYHGNLAALAAAGTSGTRRPVLWNIRSTLCDVDQEKRTTTAVIRVGARLSRWPAHIVYPSETAAVEHEAAGYSAHRRVLIGNGFDTARFRPDAELRLRARTALGVTDDRVLLGHVARFHPMKDHAGLLRAAALLRDAGVRFHLAMIGRGVDDGNAELAGLRRELGLEGCVSLLGERRDVADVTPGFDVAVSASSWGEAFPNVLGEAMACGVPCVATDVGDSRRVVGDGGLVVDRRDPAALAAAVERLARLDREGRARLGEAARARVLAHYSLPAIVAQYEDLWASATGAARRAA